MPLPDEPTVNIKQAILVDKFIAYIDINRKRSRVDALTEKEKGEYKKGLCYGFSVVHSYMNATEKLDWWKALLTTLSQWEWDGDEASLQTKTNLPGSQSIDETYDSLFQRAVSYVLFNFGGESVNEITDSNQVDFLTIEGLFETEKGEKIKDECHAIASGHFSKDSLNQLLNETTFSSKSICLMHSLTHTCAIRFDSEEKKWFFYDPNNNDGERECNNKSELIQTIQESLGETFEIEVASWDKDQAADIKFLTKAYDEICETNPAELVEGKGLLLLTKHPDLLSLILEKAKTNASLEKFIAEYQSITDPVIKKLFIEYSAKLDNAVTENNYDAIISKLKTFNPPNTLWEKVLTHLSSNDMINSEDKIKLYATVNANILISDTLDHTLLQKKIAILMRIEDYIKTRLNEKLFSREIKTKDIGFFKTEGSQKVTEAKIKDAGQLKIAILQCKTHSDLESTIQNSIKKNNVISGWIHRKGEYGKCLDDCKTLARVETQQIHSHLDKRTL